MAGIYLHIPFCKKACHYCDFHFSTNLGSKDAMLSAMIDELKMEAKYISEKVETIYFGGGTPSVLSASEVNRLTEAIFKNYSADRVQEITLEANPDDLTISKLKELRGTPVTRLSIGVQSFFEEDLRFFNRSHTTSQAEFAIKAAQDAGLSNISIDLIYGSPTTSSSHWLQNLMRVEELSISHLSAYALTVEERTALAGMIKLGKTKAPSDDQAHEQFLTLLDFSEQFGFEQYELSNFAKGKHYGIHNDNYWKGIPYLGIGPSAHSFDGSSRKWNVSNNHGYIRAMQAGKPDRQEEQLSMRNKFNEFVMINLRTARGIDLERVEKLFGLAQRNYLGSRMAKFISDKKLIMENNIVYLSREGKFFADGISSDLFVENEIS